MPMNRDQRLQRRHGVTMMLDAAQARDGFRQGRPSQVAWAVGYNVRHVLPNSVAMGLISFQLREGSWSAMGLSLPKVLGPHGRPGYGCSRRAAGRRAIRCRSAHAPVSALFREGESP
jgi:hypothetical protein